MTVEFLTKILLTVFLKQAVNRFIFAAKISFFWFNINVVFGVSAISTKWNLEDMRFLALLDEVYIERRLQLALNKHLS